MPAANNGVTLKSSAAIKFGQYVIFFIAMLPAVIFAYRKPSYNWDMLPYMAIISGINQDNTDSIHRLVYEYTRKNVPAEVFNQLSESSEYRRTMAENASVFYEQLPFYTVKPLYTQLCSLLYHCGFSLTKSTLLPSIIAFLLIGLLLFYWLRKYYRFLFSFASSLVLMYSGFMISAARLSGPDAPSSLFILYSFYLIAEKTSLLLIFLCLLLSVFIRIDNVLAAFFILSFIFICRRAEAKYLLRAYIIMGSLLALAFFMITTHESSGNWSVFYYPTFVHYYNTSYSFHSKFSFPSYFSLLNSKLTAGILFSHLSFFLLLTLLIIYNKGSFSFKKMESPQLLCILILLILATRFLLFPDISDRFYIAYYLVIAIMFIKKFVPYQNRPKAVQGAY